LFDLSTFHSSKRGEGVVLWGVPGADTWSKIAPRVTENQSRLSEPLNENRDRLLKYKQWSGDAHAEVGKEIKDLGWQTGCA